MISTILHPQSQILYFRLEVVRGILKLDPLASSVKRADQFLAVSIFDNFLIKRQALGDSATHIDSSSAIFYSISCAKLACKFNNQSYPKACKLGEILGYKGDSQSLNRECLTKESQILETLDYQIPLETFYTQLEEIEWEKYLKERDIAYFLKLFISGLQFSNQLTQNRDYGRKIFENIRFKNRREPKVNTFIQNTKQWAKQQKLHSKLLK